MLDIQVTIKATATRRLTSVTFWYLTCDNALVDLIEYLLSDEFFENEQDAFDDLPLNQEAKIAIEFRYDEGDMSVGLFPGWMVESVTVLELADLRRSDYLASGHDAP